MEAVRKALGLVRSDTPGLQVRVEYGYRTPVECGLDMVVSLVSVGRTVTSRFNDLSSA